MTTTSGDEGEGLFETRAARGGAVHKALSTTILAAIISVWTYRLTHIPAAAGGRYAWIGMLCSEVVFGLYWIICQSCRWNVVHRFPFKHRLFSTARSIETFLSSELGFRLIGKYIPSLILAITFAGTRRSCRR